MEETFSNVALNKQRYWKTFLFAIRQLFFVKKLVKMQLDKKEYHEGRNGIT